MKYQAAIKVLRSVSWLVLFLVIAGLYWYAMLPERILYHEVPPPVQTDTPDGSFSILDAQQEDFQRPPLQPELIGDLDYLSALPRANGPTYVTEYGCTNSVKLKKYRLENTGSDRIIFKIPAAYKKLYPHTSGGLPDYPQKSELKNLKISLPDFRPYCLRDIQYYTPEQNMAGHGFRSGMEMSLYYLSDGEYFEPEYSIGWLRRNFNVETGQEILPGLFFYKPNFERGEIESRYLANARVFLLPIESELRDRYAFACGRDIDTDAIETFACTGYGSVDLQSGKKIHYRLLINGFMPEWQRIMEAAEQFIRRWYVKQ